LKEMEKNIQYHSTHAHTIIIIIIYKRKKKRPKQEEKLAKNLAQEPKVRFNSLAPHAFCGVYRGKETIGVLRIARGL